MNLDEDAVREALHGLNEKGLAGTASSADSRVAKYEHRLQEAFNFNRRETAILCVLLLRGPQTPGELRGRAERMHRFEDLSEVQSGLHNLMQREPPLAKVLPRQPGAKESRYMHLLSGDVEPWQPPLQSSGTSGNSTDMESIARLESEIAGLHKEIADLRQQFSEFKAQFGS